jgi:transketolase
MPSSRLFEQAEEYRQSVLPAAATARPAVEAASPFGGKHWTGVRGAILGLDRFGASALGPALFQEYGFTVEHVVDQALALVDRGERESR